MKIQFNKLPSNPNDNTLVFFIPENDKKNNKGQIQGLDQDTLDRISNDSFTGSFNTTQFFRCFKNESNYKHLLLVGIGNKKDNSPLFL